MAQEQFIERGLTVLSAAGDRAVDVAVRVSDFAREDTTRSIAAVGAFVVVYIGAMGLLEATRRREIIRDESANKKPKS